jgi:hypothetical protein
VLHGDDLRRSRRVVDLAAELIALDELTYRDEPLGRRDEGAVRLARRALRLLLEADVEPDGAVEGGVLVDEDRLQLGLERVALLVVGEVAALGAPGDGGLDGRSSA